MVVEDAVETVAFVDVAVDGIFELFGGETLVEAVSFFPAIRSQALGDNILLTREVVGLTLHGTDTAHLPHELA